MLALFAVAGVLAENHRCPAEESVAPWVFVSIPDFLNNDVDYPEPRWDDATDYVLRAIKAENPDFVLVAGDLVMGRWSKDREHLDMMADKYYCAWVRRMQAHGIKYYVAVGDHEVGDDPWPAGKRELIPDYKAAFRRHLKMPENGPEKFRGTAYSVLHKNLLLATVDVFDTDDQGHMQIRVTGDQLVWLTETFEKHQGVPHRVVMGHIPVLPKWLWRSSSRLSLPGGSDTEFWKTLGHSHVDLYLCGEVHDISLQQQGGVLQVVHGSQPSNVPEFNYLKVTVHPDRLQLELKSIPTVVRGPVGFDLDPFGVDDCCRRIVTITQENKERGFQTVGTAVIDKPGGKEKLTKPTGYFETRFDPFD